jgi:hypothetical protein
MAHCAAFRKANMGHHLEQDEDAPLWEAVKAAGQYLDNIEVFDLRYLTKGQLMMFGSIVIAKFAENRAEWFENRRHLDDTFQKDIERDAKGSKPGELNDEIPL